MKPQRGFIGIGLLIAIVVGLAVVGGGAYYVTHQQSKQTPTASSTPVSASATTTFSASPLSGVAPLTVTFSNLPHTASGVDLDFGDGTQPATDSSNGCWPVDGTVPNPCTHPALGTVTHTYTKPGTYTAKLVSMMPVSQSGGPVLGTFTITVRGSNESGVSVSGMSKYTDNDFGFSFWYPSGWKITNEATDPYLLSDGTVQKQLSLTGGAETIHMLEFTSPSRTISVIGGACGFCTSMKFYFDTNTHTWMQQYPEGVGGDPMATQAQVDQTKVPSPADVSENTMGGLHIFHALSQRFGDSIVPLSARNFVFVYADSQGEDSLELPLVNTIVALDPAVATPVSAAEQQATIEAEKNAYSSQ